MFMKIVWCVTAAAVYVTSAHYNTY